MASLRAQSDRKTWAYRRFRAFAFFIRGTVVLAKSRNGNARITVDAVTDESLLQLHPAPESDTTSINESSNHALVNSNLLSYFPFADTNKALSEAEVIKVEKEALQLFEQAIHISTYKKLSIAVSVVAFFNEFGLAGMEEPDYLKAERLYNLAAGMGCTFALARLAFLKMHGRPNITIDQQLAEHYRTTLSALLRNNKPRSPSSSLSWLQILATNNHPAAQFCVALCYYNGIGTAKDKELDTNAYVWCQRAAVQGQAGAMNMLGNLHTEGAGGAQRIPALGLRWYIRAAEQRDAAAIYNIGTLFERGLGIERDTRIAAEWYTRAAVFGSINAHNVLGIFREQGVGLQQDASAAVHHYRTAATAGHPHAAYNLARCHHDGFGVARDDSQALALFRTAANQNHVLSVLSVAICFDAAIGTSSRDALIARSYFWQAAARGSKEAKSRLAESIALELLIAARPLLAGRILTEDQVKRNRKTSKNRYSIQPVRLRAPSLSPSPMRIIAERKYHPSYDDATEQLLERLGLNTRNSSPSMNLNPSYYSNKTVAEMMFPSISLKNGAESYLESDEIVLPKQATSIAILPTEIIMLILSFFNSQDILSTTQLSKILNISSDRTTLKPKFSKEKMLMLFGVPQVALWVGNKDWCKICKNNCRKIKHYMTRLGDEN
ncbi:hypothetical protein HK100_011787 [Physocladia obscura]|uniref:F-box domain-containing protein n=1 Tax=Physocladia obscura TaxID=109957 RepID=A0AAD5T394_9FUNG|nr:hypothetical protein HK100_011787 [Physocladia obscura]